VHPFQFLTAALTLSFVGSHETALITLQNTGPQVEGLKIQLDDTLGVEDIFVQLIERNLMLSEVPLVFAI